jgi:phage terminase large subunit-like protein
VGIEKGSLKNAIMPYLEDQMRRLNVYPSIEELTHGNQKKTERIAWALAGLFEHGRIKLNEGEWNQKFREQLLDFPNPLAHDDLPDALAYIAQLAEVSYIDEFEIDYWGGPIDELSGY